MGKMTEYMKVETLEANDTILTSTSEGTKQITAQNLANSLESMLSIVDNLDISINTKDENGLVPATNGRGNRIWSTDPNGNPDWRYLTQIDNDMLKYVDSLNANNGELKAHMFGHTCLVWFRRSWRLGLISIDYWDNTIYWLFDRGMNMNEHVTVEKEAESRNFTITYDKSFGEMSTILIGAGTNHV